MNRQTEKLRKKYMQHPPESMTSEEVHTMSDENLLDMDYFLHEDVFEGDAVEEDGFYIF